MLIAEEKIVEFLITHSILYAQQNITYALFEIWYKLSNIVINLKSPSILPTKIKFMNTFKRLQLKKQCSTIQKQTDI